MRFIKTPRLEISIHKKKKRSLHLVMSTRCDWCEFPFIPDEYQLLEEPIKAEKGWVSAIEKPGLGVEINQEMFKEHVKEIKI